MVAHWQPGSSTPQPPPPRTPALWALAVAGFAACALTGVFVGVAASVAWWVFKLLTGVGQ